MVEWMSYIIAIVVVVLIPAAIAEISGPSFSVPIVSFRGLPTK